MVLTWMSATRNLAKKLMRALFQATLLASVRSKRRMSAIVFCPFKIHLVMNLLRITARWPFMHLQRSIFVLYLVLKVKQRPLKDRSLEWVCLMQPKDLLVLDDVPQIAQLIKSRLEDISAGEGISLIPINTKHRTLTEILNHIEGISGQLKGIYINAHLTLRGSPYRFRYSGIELLKHIRLMPSSSDAFNSIRLLPILV